MSHNNYSNHGSPFMQSPTGSDSHSGWSYSEQSRTTSPEFAIVLSALDPPANSFQSAFLAAQRSVPELYEPSYPTAQQQQQTQAPYSTYFSYEQLSAASNQMHGGSDSSTSPPSSLAGSPPLDVSGGGRWHGQPYYPSYANMQILSTSSDLSSQLSVDTSNFQQYQSSVSLDCSAEHSLSQEAVTTAAEANTHYQQSMAMTHASFFHTIPSSRGTAQLPYARAPTALSLVSCDSLPRTPEPTIKKKRKRLDARQFKALSKALSRTEYPSTDMRKQLASDLGILPRSVQVWFQNQRQKSKRRGERSRASPQASIDQVTGSLPPDTPPDVAHPRASSAPVNPMGEPSYLSRSPPPDI